MDSLNKDFENARVQAERLQNIVTSELEATIKGSGGITTSFTTGNGSTITDESNSFNSTSNSSSSIRGRESLLNVLGLTVGIGWILQSSLIHKDSPSSSQQSN